MNILGIVEENVKKDDVAVIKILALDVEYTAVQ